MRSRSWSEKPTSEISLTAYRLHQESSKTVQAASNGDCEKEGAATCQAQRIRKETQLKKHDTALSRQVFAHAADASAPAARLLLPAPDIRLSPGWRAPQPSPHAV